MILVKNSILLKSILQRPWSKASLANDSVSNRESGDVCAQGDDSANDVVSEDGGKVPSDEETRVAGFMVVRICTCDGHADLYLRWLRLRSRVVGH